MATDSNYNAPEYEPVTSVENMRNAPRFGHSSDFYKLFSYDSDEQVDYANGLIFITCLLFSFFLFWSILILVFKCMGPYQVGFLSGYHFIQPDPATDLTMKKPYRRPRRVRITFVCCAIVVLVFSGLMATKGFKNLQDTSKSLDTATTDVQQLLDESDTIAHTLFDIGDSSIAIRDKVVAELGKFCPKHDNIEKDTGIDFDEIAKETISRLEGLQNFIETDVADLIKDLDRIRDVTDDVEEANNKADVEEWQVTLLVIPLAVTATILLVGTLVAWMGMSFDWFQCAQTWFVLPLFVIWITFCWICCSFFGFLGVANSDFCSGGEYSGKQESPDGTFLHILKVQEFDFDKLLYKALRFYVARCTSAFPFQFIEEYEDKLIEGLNKTSELLDSFEQVSIPRLNVLCGKDFAPVYETLQKMHQNLQVLDGSADLTLSLLSCKRINPIYVNTFHEAACTYSVTGVTWIFSSLLVISVAGMLMITFRASWLDAEYSQPNCDDVNESDTRIDYEAPVLADSSVVSSKEASLEGEAPQEQYVGSESCTLGDDEIYLQESVHSMEDKSPKEGENTQTVHDGTGVQVESTRRGEPKIVPLQKDA